MPRRKLIDEENPEWTAEDFAKARPAAEVLPSKVLAVLPKRKRGDRGKQKNPTKAHLTIRLDQDVVEHFRRTGSGWQSRINATLRKSIKRTSK
jgi:uncharacterized protein (DUF4415 family)